MNTDIISYYRERALEYEKVYYKPERQPDLLRADKIFRNIFGRKKIIEIACGTGYWTEKIASVADSILATDINESVLDVAKSKEYSPAKVEFMRADIFQLHELRKYEAVFGGFIWSHIKMQELDTFIEIINGLVKPNGTVVFMDNNYVEGSSLPVTDTDERGNTYQERKLENGKIYKVLKNFPKADLFRELLAPRVSAIDVTNLQYYWILQYTI